MTLACHPGVIRSIAEVSQIVQDADPDATGEIDFEEFMVVMRTQGADSGGLADVVSAASNFLGMANPFSWFGSADEEMPLSADGVAA